MGCAQFEHANRAGWSLRKFNPAVLDDVSDLEKFELIILTDTTVITEPLRIKLEAYHQNGGKLTVSQRGGMNEHGEWVMDFLPVEHLGNLEMQPTYWRTAPEFWSEVSTSDRVFYEPGLKPEPTENSRVLIDRLPPYFERTDTHFMSHLQAPPVNNVCEFPGVIAGKNVVIFAAPIFGAYRQSGSGFVRDVLEEASSFAGEVLRIPGATKVKIVEGPELQTLEPGVSALPAARGRLLIEAE